MSTKNNILTALAGVFSTGPDTEYDDSQEILMFHPALIEVLNNLVNKEKKVEEAVNVTGGSKKGKNGIRKKYEAPTIEVEEMSPEKLEKMIKTLNGEDKERDNY